MIRHALACLALVACGGETPGSDAGAEDAITDAGRCILGSSSPCENGTSCFINCVPCAWSGFERISNGPGPFVSVCRNNTWEPVGVPLGPWECRAGLFVDPECTIWADGGDASSDAEAGADGGDAASDGEAGADADGQAE